MSPYINMRLFTALVGKAREQRCSAGPICIPSATHRHPVIPCAPSEQTRHFAGSLMVPSDQARLPPAERRQYVFV